ncbi:hypothetical protein MANES_06G033500v8 [Manihot esculenta]|uniref:Uncharacterized protein n=1 Tax=Manihot esculenta TaxID=3983 RepID=A0A2C9VP15_MANES|nr:hypothetical protein MANES_06G033500v8 [Manihot esculenta]
MKRVVFGGLLFIIIFCTSLSCYAFQGSSSPQHNPSLRAKHLKDQTEKVDIKSFIRHKKGSYGGGDLLRPRTPHRNGAIKFSILKSSYFLSILLSYVLVLVIVILV